MLTPFVLTVRPAEVEDSGAGVGSRVSGEPSEIITPHPGSLAFTEMPVVLRDSDSSDCPLASV